MPSPVAGVRTRSNAARASRNCFWESSLLCDSKLCGASCAHPFAATAVRTIAWTANSLNSLLTIRPPIPKGSRTSGPKDLPEILR
jgi:hypothetical protein